MTWGDPDAGGLLDSHWPSLDGQGTSGHGPDNGGNHHVRPRTFAAARPAPDLGHRRTCHHHHVAALRRYAQVPGPAARRRAATRAATTARSRSSQHGDFDSIPNNDPHVGCTFTVEWYGFDKGADIISTVTFEMQSPTRTSASSVDGPSTSSSAATRPAVRDGDRPRRPEDYTLTFDGPPHPNQGYHVKLTVHTPGSKGTDKKYKVFWVTGCAPVQPPTPGISPGEVGHRLGRRRLGRARWGRR